MNRNMILKEIERLEKEFDNWKNSNNKNTEIITNNILEKISALEDKLDPDDSYFSSKFN
jgi:hypothetical protein